MACQVTSKKNIKGVEVSGHGIVSDESSEHMDGGLESLLDLIESMESEGKHFLIY